MEPMTRVFILDEHHERFFGEGPCRLLRGIEQYGSLRASAASMGMAYTKALRLMKHAEEALGVPLARKTIGGKHGGGSELTQEGKEFLEKYEEGYDVVCAIKVSSKENPVVFALREAYYKILAQLSSAPLIQNFTGYGLYSRRVVDAVKSFNDFSYFRGVLAEVGFKRIDIPFEQPLRKYGKSSYNIFRYYDYAMTGFVNYTKLPLRLSVFCGTFLAIACLLVAAGYFVAKLIWWNTFSLGIAPLVIGIFFLGAVQLLFIGMIGEYIGAIWTQVKKRPLVIEEERINFDQ